MQRNLYLFGLIFVFLLNLGFAGSPADNHVIRVGYYMPDAAKNGIILGYQLGKTIDDRVSFGLSTDLYFKSYTKETEVASDSTFSGQVVTIQREVDFSSWMLPIQANVIVNIPMDVSGMNPYLGGGLGFALLLNREVNYINDDTDMRFFSAFVWNIAGGLNYELGSNSAARFELFYNRAVMKGSRGKTEAGFPTYDELNMSGLGIRIGLVMEL